MADKTRIVAQDTFVSVGDGWFNYYTDPDNPGKFYKEPCPGFIYADGEWKAASIDGGYLEAANIESKYFIRTGREQSWTPVEEIEAVVTQWNTDE